MILVTGAAGFIGFHLSQRLLRDGQAVHGLDNLNDYYDVSLKEARLKLLRTQAQFSFDRSDISNPAEVQAAFAAHRPKFVVHLAAQPGVRHSLVNPRAYVESNVSGFLNILEGCRHHPVQHLVFASSSSVYGLNSAMPLSTHQPTDHPISIYGATKKANEAMAHSYSHLFGIPTTGLRFFTVYGPWGRPDMAVYLFTKAILEDKAIDLYDQGRAKRDFTYIDDIIEGIVRLIPRPASPNSSWNSEAPDPATSAAPYRLYNIGNHSPIETRHVIDLLEKALGKKASLRLLSAQPGEVPATFADVSDLSHDFGFAPSTSIETGLARFVEWYRSFYGKSA